MKHTQGKWSYIVDTPRTLIVGSNQKNRSKIIHVSADDCFSNKCSFEEAEANAKLIASAPELLEALKEVNKCLDNEFQTKDELIPDWIVQAYQVIGKAIKKAEG